MPHADCSHEETIHAFAKQYRLRLSHDTDGTTVIRGHASCQLYEYDEGKLAVLIASDLQKPTPRRWAGIRKKCLAAGMILRQNGDGEGALSFDPNNRQQARLAIKIAGVRPKRQLSPEHRAKLLASGFQKRANPTLEGVFSDNRRADGSTATSESEARSLVSCGEGPVQNGDTK